MIRPITLTPEVIQECVEEFRKSITETRMYSGSLSYSKSFKWEDKVPKAVIRFSVEAYMKMRLLVENFSSEIAWQCVVFRDDVDKNVFHMTDIVVEPQVVTGTTVDTDQEEYEKWLISLPVEVFNNLHANMHSHVNMSCSPSNTDKNHWTNVINALAQTDDMFQIFMIWNKKWEHYAQVYDLTNNIYYDGTDVEVDVEDFSGWGLEEFLKNAKASVKTQTVVPKYQGQSYSSPYYGQSQSHLQGYFNDFKSYDKDYNASKRADEAKARKEQKAARRESDFYSSGGYWDDDGYWDSHR